jgi:putative endonuclease
MKQHRRRTGLRRCARNDGGGRRNFPVIARSGATKQSRSARGTGAAPDCFAALAMTVGRADGLSSVASRSSIAALAGEAGMKQPAVYIMANRRNGTLYTGVTSDLAARGWQHKQGATGFTARYDCKRLVWYELHGTMEAAILREKQLKAGPRRRKVALIEAMNPAWNDLYESIVW